MNEVKEFLRNIEQSYKLFQQQQFTFIAALEHCRENAHDKIRPISSISQVQNYMEHYCNNSTDNRILQMFLKLCSEMSKLCQQFESLHPGTPATNNILEKCKILVSQSNDLSSLRARYPHDVVNHLSCDEARNHYGGVVSLIPITLDLMKEWIAHSEKLPRKAIQHVSDQESEQKIAGDKISCHCVATQTLASTERNRDPKGGKTEGKMIRPPWRPPGGPTL
ncbi:sperm acrosome-associated protein 9 isoform X1 [Sarcophilus harrisii]|uniref:Sperm acrosome associated 9 n=1 Tax=Sarcophilus harrisii TaxID=9305 RepID=A0A7N4PD44_SARHA|nr:sperm acrosome-associated protein 9 isoform X1 [Sarcophilus harrisii]XP_012409431.1 sperm acrosome-associated protein 9 isoform X1 [Sarcophilus harrisii]XP_012409432.1 sperm acrosome-associated protein 9 isoform X1 [Sarcophilus harrisii]